MSSPIEHYFALRSRRVVTQGEIKAAVVVIKHGIIVAIAKYDADLPCHIEDLGNSVLMPGIVDTHVHVGEPGFTEHEGFATVTRAAVAGGITTLVDMPNHCTPVTTNKTAFEQKLAAVRDQLWADCGFWGGFVPDNISQLHELLNAGVLGIKSVVNNLTNRRFPAVDDEHLRQVMSILSQYDAPYLLDVEFADAARSEGQSDEQSEDQAGQNDQHCLASSLEKPEDQAIQLVANIATKVKQDGYDPRVHITHLSSAGALQTISEAQMAGVRLTSETCPHYLCAQDNIDQQTAPQSLPPLPDEDEREHLWQAVSRGQINFIVSGHRPQIRQPKPIDNGDLVQVEAWNSALQFSLPLLWTEAQQRGFTLPQISHLMSLRTAKFAGISTFKGKIRVGFDADLVIFNDQAEYEIRHDMIKHSHQFTPYAGMKVFGEVEKTFVRGHLVYDHGDFVHGPVGQPILKGRVRR